MEDLSPISYKIEHILDRVRARMNSFLENKLMMHWAWVLALWLVSWAILLSVARVSYAVVFIGMGLLAVHITHGLQQAIMRSVPKRIISHTSDKAVLITGCDTGFGNQLAMRLDKLGFTVFACCLFPSGEGAKQLQQNTSDRLQILEIDVTNEDTIDVAFVKVKNHLDEHKLRLWSVVNNAGIASITEIEWCPIEVYQKVFDVNALGLIRVTKTFLPLVRRNKGNRIIIVASLAGRYTFAGFSAYSMSKHAAVSFADALRLEMKKWNISVHTVEPTLYRTPICEASIISTNLDKIWEECPEHVKNSYGTEYLQDFKKCISHHLSRAKPQEKVHEVVDDMIDAVAGEEPKMRYVPSLQTQMRAQFLGSLPHEVLDNLFSKSTPKTPPADLNGSAQKFVF